MGGLTTGAPLALQIHLEGNGRALRQSTGITIHA